MSEKNFVDDFISSCILKGKKSEKDICATALEEMHDIDEKLRESNQLRIRLKNLKQVLRELGHESIKKARTNDEIKILSDIDNIENSAYLNMMANICEFVELNVDKSFTSREIINEIGSMDNDKEVYICIKTLYDNGILSRSEERNVIKGPNWHNRPQNYLKDKIA